MRQLHTEWEVSIIKMHNNLLHTLTKLLLRTEGGKLTNGPAELRGNALGQTWHSNSCIMNKQDMHKMHA